jgi:hypothetical protein
MNTKIILATVAIALVAAALVGLSTAQLANQTPTATPNSQIQPPCITSNNGAIPQYCINAATGEPYCANNGANTGYCQNNANSGCNQNAYGYGYCGQVQNQPQFGNGMMGGNNNGFGRCR